MFLSRISTFQLKWLKKIQNLPAKEEENNTKEAADIEITSRLYNDS